MISDDNNQKLYNYNDPKEAILHGITLTTTSANLTRRT